jgi:hypothetical protein
MACYVYVNSKARVNKYCLKRKAVYIFSFPVSCSVIVILKLWRADDQLSIQKEVISDLKGENLLSKEVWESI